MPITSLSSLEVLLRTVEADPELKEKPEVLANLKTRIRSLQRAGLSQDEQDVAVALVLARKALLLTIPTLRGVEAVHATVRVQEQIHKGLGALRRKGRSVPGAGVPRRLVPTSRAVPQYDEGDD